MITNTQDLTKSVQPLKGISQNFQAFSQQTFSKVTPKNIKLRFMKNNGKEIKKSESNNKGENFISKKASVDIQNMNPAQFPDLQSPKNGLKI